MAIQFIRVEIVSAGLRSSAVGLSAYISGEMRIKDRGGKVYDFRAKKGDILAHAIALPEDAPAWARTATGEQLWNRAEEAEMLKDGSRLRARAQLAYTVIVALPNELTVEQNAELLRGWIASEYTSKGLAVEWAILGPKPGSRENVHAHALVSTRALGDSGFGVKVRNVIECRFRAGVLVGKADTGARWRAYQESYFATRGLDVSVRPRSAVPLVRVSREAIEGRPERKYNTR